MKTVVVVSGGMDSVTLLHKVVKENGAENVKAISFNYGQVHVKELKCAKWQCEQLEVEHIVVDLTNLSHLLPSTLTNVGEVPKGHYESESMKKTVVPFRNSIMATIAMGYASGLGYDAIALGVHSGDHFIYPDCRPEFMAVLRLQCFLGDFKSLKLYVPFEYSDKTAIIKEGLELGVDYAHTWTSYSDTLDYTTGSSVERNQAFIANGIKDPLYTDEEWEKAKEYATSVVKE